MADIYRLLHQATVYHPDHMASHLIATVLQHMPVVWSAFNWAALTQLFKWHNSIKNHTHHNNRMHHHHTVMHLHRPTDPLPFRLTHFPAHPPFPIVYLRNPMVPHRNPIVRHHTPTVLPPTHTFHQQTHTFRQCPYPQNHMAHQHHPICHQYRPVHTEYRLARTAYQDVNCFMHIPRLFSSASHNLFFK